MKEIITKNELDEVIGNNQEKLIILDFYADWCGPCKVLGETFEDLCNKRDDFLLVKVNIEESDELTNEFKIRNIPTLIFMKDGFIVDKNIGVVGKDVLIQKIEANIVK